MSKRSLGPKAQRQADKDHRREQNARAAHNRRMKDDPEYRAAVIERRVFDGEARHAERVRPAREAKARRILAAFGCTPEWAEALSDASSALRAAA